MSCFSETFLLALVTLSSCVCSVTLPGIEDRRFIDECVKEHNRARSSVDPPASNMLHMTWDVDLAITAREWAKECRFSHNPQPLHPNFTSIGENIWAGYPPSSFKASAAIKSWEDEKKDYDYNRQVCRNVCGHYTQVVWASSTKVGCAANLCPNGVKGTSFQTKEGVVFVCNYAPAGNVNNRKPYESKGPACSGCEGACVDNMCRSDWTSARGSDYVSVLVVRPIALLLTFAAAYAVRHFYPDVFCYE